MKYAVVIPTYNEAHNLPSLVDAILNLPQNFYLFIIDDNSPDGSGEIAEQLAKSIPGRLTVLHRPAKLGLGSAYRLGFAHALEWGAHAIAQMDADFSHPPEKLDELAQALHGCDVAMGSRYVPGGAVDRHWPLWRKGLSAFGNWYARTILGIPIRDVTGGFRLWRREALLAIPFQQGNSQGYVFQVEMAYLAYRLGFAIREIPFYFADRQEGKSKMSLRIQLEAAYKVWQIRFAYSSLRSTR
ncbi:MAG: polyprenol monophosphomannose synthase [Anaerolineales bacterium]|nr:polyprenol monophosphomannose synthase [Anaerolineales bacterium]MCS7249112.1 polyprenol monophosphomannose synthase [Anaerolineales bacterium]MDW8162925.1 polyprenol monophosphomannose synthase [Anaerolineales bacterium]MDW8446330.1 polyprenol monophosphomannose synthase [Anaerolineales bacterium]